MRSMTALVCMGWSQVEGRSHVTARARKSLKSLVCHLLCHTRFQSVIRRKGPPTHRLFC